MWDGSPFVTCPKHNGKAYLREPLIGNAGYVHRYANAADSDYRYAVLRMSARDERKHHVARG